MDANVKHLAIHYHHFRFDSGGGFDPNIRSVSIEHSPLAGGGGAHVQVFLFKPSVGIWQAEDWTPGPGTFKNLRTMCFDVAAERIAEMVVIVSNGSKDQDAVTPAGEHLRLGINNIGCWRWQGTASHRQSGGTGGASGTLDSNVVSIVLERVPPPAGLETPLVDYKLIGGTFSQSIVATVSGGCTLRASITGVAVTNGANTGADVLTIQSFGMSGMDTDGLPLGGYRGLLTTYGGIANGTSTCDNQTVPAQVLTGDIWFRAGTAEGTPEVTARNGVLDETLPLSGGTDQYMWHFTPMREP
jgi:hypothetical protein